MWLSCQAIIEILVFAGLPVFANPVTNVLCMEMFYSAGVSFKRATLCICNVTGNEHKFGTIILSVIEFLQNGYLYQPYSTIRVIIMKVLASLCF